MIVIKRIVIKGLRIGVAPGDAGDEPCFHLV